MSVRGASTWSPASPTPPSSGRRPGSTAPSCASARSTSPRAGSAAATDRRPAVIALHRAAEPYDVVVVGTGFASTFFVKRFLERSPRNVRVLVLERGKRFTHKEQREGARATMLRDSHAAVANATPDKTWRFLNAFGGGSNCWYACTPRMLPDDFRLRSKF